MSVYTRLLEALRSSQPLMPSPSSRSNTAPQTPSPLCAIRGTQMLNSSELQAHLAAVVRLENIGVLLGAGASLRPLGGMTMEGLWSYFVKTYRPSFSWLTDHQFISSRSDLDVEVLLDTLEVTRLEWTRTGRFRKLNQLRRARSDLFRSIIHASLLNDQWWQSPALLETDASSLTNHRRLLQKLTAARQPGQPSPWVFTTNYDLAIEWAAETLRLKVTNGFDGLHRRVFESHNFDLGYRNMLARGEARFGTYNIYLAKLHGSLTWRIGEEQTVEEVASRSLWPDIEHFLQGKLDDLPSHMVYPSSAKYIQTVGFLLGELLRRFTEFLARPQSCLIVSGYSFSDGHLNRILTSALQNPTCQLVIYAPTARYVDNKLDLSECSPWLQHVGELASPQVTIVGTGPAAHFGALVAHLPDPAIYDEQAARIREMIKKYRQSLDSSGTEEDAVE